MSTEPSDSTDLVFKPPTPPKGTSLLTFERVCAATEVAFQKGGKVLPGVTEIAQASSVNKHTVAKIINTLEFKHEMSLRGIKWSASGRITEGLTPEQVYCIGIITDPTNRKPMAEKLRSAGVPYNTYRNWLKQPAFAARINQFGEDLLGDNIASIHARLVQRADAGDVSAMKLFYEVSGRHDPARQQTVDIMRIIGLILESVTRRISDPVVLAGIQDDLDAIMAGDTPVDDGTMPNNYVPSQDMIEGKVVPHHDSRADSVRSTGSHLAAVSGEDSAPDLKTAKELEIEHFLKSNGLNPEDY